MANPTKGQKDKKVLRYIKAYREILNMIENGLYPENSKLPSESELSHMRGISRMTFAAGAFAASGRQVYRHASRLRQLCQQGAQRKTCRTGKKDKPGLYKLAVWQQRA
ncbi:GntR family transcriptional regulator [Brevibacillus agri]|uniref:GntR family transcriptional regulator n=1 Tax=Brevibacillus agri TaxID=51101 RepID=UPI002E215715|nr:GntR family transcriptional regulator [Brevibacillus agri]